MSPLLSLETSYHIRASCPMSSSRAQFRLTEHAKDAPDSVLIADTWWLAAVTASRLALPLVSTCAMSVYLTTVKRKDMSGKPTAAAAHRIKQGSLCNNAIRNACSLPVYALLAHNACGLLSEPLCMHPPCIYEGCIEQPWLPKKHC